MSSDTSLPSPNSPTSPPNSDDTPPPIPFVLREEFEAFTRHYNTNMEKALETTTNLLVITSSLELRYNKAILLLLLWCGGLSLVVLAMVWGII